ncbi:MAG: 16S rRNA (cytidine(1402)-2'-O)-methyltransferase [Rickettsiales bacterium]
MHIEVHNDNLLEPGLYVVSTPIGNLEDISIRALKTLSSVDLVVCEDSRVTNKLLSKYGLKKKIFVYNDHSSKEDRKKLLQLIQDKTAALVSDAGTPLISDPGLKLIRFFKENNIFVTAIPGACAVINALVLSGLDTNMFEFYGFLPIKHSDRLKIINNLISSEKTSLIYETAKKFHKLLNEVIEINPEQKIVVVREMTKLYEEVIEDTASNLLQKKFKGELVVIFPAQHQETNIEINKDIIETLKKLSTKDGQTILKFMFPTMKKNDLYNLLKN